MSVLAFPPQRFEFGGRKIAERRMDALGAVHIINEATKLRLRVGEVLVFRQFDLFLLDCAHNPFSIPILRWCANCCHADLCSNRLQPPDILRRSILNALVAMVNARRMLRQRVLEGGQCYALAQRAAERPAAKSACKDSILSAK